MVKTMTFPMFHGFFHHELLDITGSTESKGLLRAQELRHGHHPGLLVHHEAPEPRGGQGLGIHRWPRRWVIYGFDAYHCISYLLYLSYKIFTCIYWLVYFDYFGQGIVLYIIIIIGFRWCCVIIRKLDFPLATLPGTWEIEMPRTCWLHRSKSSMQVAPFFSIFPLQLRFPESLQFFHGDFLAHESAMHQGTCYWQHMIHVLNPFITL